VTTPRFDLTAPAERDLEEIFFEVKERHVRLVAERVYDNLLRTFELVADARSGWNEPLAERLRARIRETR
jgi:hypothetical protein